jgi:hypothetical protein
MSTCHQEIDILQRDIALKESLSRISLSEFPECLALSEFLKASGSKPSSLDDYTHIVMEELQSWREPWMTPKKMPDLTAEDTKLVDAWRYSNFDKTLREQLLQNVRQLEENVGGSQDPSPDHVSDIIAELRAEGDWNDCETEQAGETTLGIVERGDDPDLKNNAYQPHSDGRLCNLLERWVRSQIKEQSLVFVEWKAPTNRPLVGFAPARFGMETLDFTQHSTTAELDHSFANSKEYMGWQETILEPPSLIRPQTAAKSPENSLEVSVQYLRALIAAQTPEEREAFAAAYLRMASCVTRVTQAEKMAYGESKWSWSRLARDDNWFHCRKLLQILANTCEI